jgi:ArsR family transcriptional regulator
MKNMAGLFRLFSDETRLRILMLLWREELCVCELMGVLGVSQPLVSRNLSLLASAGIVTERRQGKLVFHALAKDIPPHVRATLKVMREALADSPRSRADIETLRECHEFQRLQGACDMKTFRRFMEERKKKKK